MIRLLKTHRWTSTALFTAVLALFAMTSQPFAQEEQGLALQTTEEAALPGADLIERGRYLATVGNCMGCHTTGGGKPYAGGRAINSRFGTLYTSNLTASDEHGLGRWSSDDFWQAMHNGRGKQGEPLYPAFPYTQYTLMSREDSDAIYAYLRALPVVEEAAPEHALKFPYNQRVLLNLWRWLYFDRGEYVADTRQSEVWNRGAYLVQGLGHCAACHSPRNAIAGQSDLLNMPGGVIASSPWYANPLSPGTRSNMANWTVDELRTYLRTGASRHGSAMGPMAQVVGESLQYATEDDLLAMATYLKSLPETKRVEKPKADTRSQDEQQLVLNTGKLIYTQQCASCHGEQGVSSTPGLPPLAGQVAVAEQLPNNAIALVLRGGFPPSTAGNPYPYGMPPFGLLLSDAEVAAVLSYIRTSWGNQGGMVSPLDVRRLRGSARQR